MNVAQALKIQLADWNLLYVKLHNFHWNVKGRDFFTLHEKFELLYNEASTYIDDIAERILALGDNPPASFKEYLDLTSLEEAKGNEDAKKMVKTIVSDFKKILVNSKAGIEAANENDDDTTVDLLTQIHVALEKHIWLFSAFLG